MDRLIAPGTVDAAHADTAPATGTPGYATDGNPATNTPATQWPAYAFNALQEEILAVILAGGLTPDRNNNSQLLQALTQQLISASTPIGAARNISASLTADGSVNTWTADELTVKDSIGGKGQIIANFNASCDLTTVGAGGMDTGTAPVSGFVAVYAIYNPTNGSKALLAVDATSVKQAEVYTGANMPSGYQYSMLMSVWPTNASRQFRLGFQADRHVSCQATQVLSTTTGGSNVSLSVATAVPKNARSADFTMSFNATTNTSQMNLSLRSTSTSLSSYEMSFSTSTSVLTHTTGAATVYLPISQTVFYIYSAAGGGTVQLFVIGYTF